MAGLPEIVTSVATLVQDLHDSRTESALRAQQIEALQEEVITKDRQVQVLERERNNQAQQIQALKLDVRQLRLNQKAATLRTAHTPPGSPEPVENVASIEIPGDATSNGGKPTFVSLPRAPGDNFDIFDNHRFGDKRADEACIWRSSKMRLVDLRKIEWKLTALPQPDRPYPGKDGPEEAAPAVPKASPSEQMTSEVQHDPRPSELRQDEPHRRYFDPADPRRDSLRNSIFGVYATGGKDSLKRGPPHPSDPDYRRKAICVHCWTTSGFCDFYGQCGTCRMEKVRCVRKLCGSGLACRNPRCPCLHPGQWDETDEEFVVERGPLPPKIR
ncbi:hypothetical protein LTR56_000640 [Elasticomyces elasticus]|nr:hypothetical protein LTR56_000640 [Elasticomyces elasticus]KAK3664418.1 hypothetical protein LTR22_004831 [Elasticomyces elasticus]KAK4919420.1 hypothetical protein LTR49_012954 [Elasticomyces elasticus]KAK5758294.1 hypothetical protein LTS12_011617 [Elasticomyces elasticus]